jgi:hypothetical protein
MLITAASTSGEQLTADQQPLVGILGYRVLVENLDPDAKLCGVTENELRFQVELGLRRNKVQVIAEPSNGSGDPVVYLQPTLLYYKSTKACFFSLVLQVRASATVRTNKQWAWASIWHDVAAGVGPKSEVPRMVQKAVNGLVDRLCNDHLAANFPRTQEQSQDQHLRQ